jgi:hypothetical protein
LELGRHRQLRQLARPLQRLHRVAIDLRPQQSSFPIFGVLYQGMGPIIFLVILFVGGLLYIGSISNCLSVAKLLSKLAEANNREVRRAHAQILRESSADKAKRKLD